LVLCTQKKGAPEEANTGERWGCLVQDRSSRFIAACATGRIGDDLVERAVALTVVRTQGHPLSWCSDGWRGYAAILRRAYRQPMRTGQRGRPALVVPPEVRLTQTIKHRGEHGKLLSVEFRAALGEGVCEPATVHIERVNGTLRDRLNALTRKTHAFAKRDATWDALVHLQLFEHNWIRPHRALRLLMNTKPLRYQPRTPAMALGLSEHPWSWITFLTTSLWLSVT
jgi:IS1 family transposase